MTCTVGGVMFGILGDRQEEDRHAADQDDDDRDHPGEDRPVDEEPGEHRLLPSLYERRALCPPCFQPKDGGDKPRRSLFGRLGKWDRHWHELRLHGQTRLGVLRAADDHAVVRFQAGLDDLQTARLLRAELHVAPHGLVVLVDDVDVGQVLIGGDGGLQTSNAWRGSLTAMRTRTNSPASTTADRRAVSGWQRCREFAACRWWR